VTDADRWLPFAPVDLAAPAALLRAVRDAGVAHEVRTHQPARHARHLAELWGLPLPEAGRATLFFAATAGASQRPLLVLVPADRKIGAPRLRQRLGADELRVLRADRSVGRVGWAGLPGAPGALPAVPGLFYARGLIDEAVFERPRVVLTLEPGCSLALAPRDYQRLAGAERGDVSGRTRLPW
jgi:prolyl-tRNA editing enzyme YbaK/EbsC (Cys-tRNA(Pro) deacylase)